jgi:hypothetical protein
MRTLLRSGLLATSIATCLIGGGATKVAAYGPEDARSFNRELGTCTVEHVVDREVQNARVRVTNGTTARFAGGTTWGAGVRQNKGVLDIAYVAACLGESADAIATFTATGASAESFAAQTYMGFSFTLSRKIIWRGLDTSRAYEFSIADNSAPTVTLGSLTLSDGTYTSAITLSEAAGDDTVFALADLTATNATATLSGSGTSFTATLTPLSDGLVALDVAAATFTDAAGNDNTAATQVSATFDGTAPTVTLSGPSGMITDAFEVTATFSEDVTGLTAGEITIEGGSVTILSGSNAGYIITIAPVLGATVTVTVPADAAEDVAGNGNSVSNTYTIQAGSPASEFEENKEEILAVVTDEALRGIRATVSSNVRMTRAARERFIRNQKQAATDSPVLSFAATPLDITGSAVMRDGILNTQGMFFGQTGSNEGGQTRLFFGDFDVQRDADGSVSAQLNGKLAWEGRISTTAMYGYYLGAELGRAALEGTFAGEQDSFGASVGAYFVAEVQPNIYLDGFASLGLGRNRLELDNGILNVASDYTTTTGTVGASLTGVVEGDGYEFWPQLQLTYGQTRIGMMSFTGEAYSLVDDTLSLDAGSVSIASGVFTAEFKVPFDGRDVSDSRALFTFAPRLICERIMTTDTTNDCGGGAEIGIASRSSDGLSNLNFNIRRDRVGSTTSTGLALNFERAF